MTILSGNSINLKDVHFSYPDSPDKPVLDIPHWSVSSGEQVFVHGPSGCGKSTLLNLLSGMLIASRGEVTVLGEDLTSMNLQRRDRFRANHIGYVFQQFNLIPYLSAIENIQLTQHFSSASNKTNNGEIEALLDKLKVAQNEWRKPTTKLSMGQQQRIAIARALINKPEIIIADEPTSSLDQTNRDNFMALLMSQVVENSITLVIVSHDMSIAQYFKRTDALPEFNLAGGAY